MKPYLVLDIETAGAPADEIMPEFEAPANYKDAEKIRAAIQAKRDAWLNEGALHAQRGRIIVLGLFHGGDGREHIWQGTGDEKAMLEKAWAVLDDCWCNRTLVGHNIWRFDIPWLARRSWVNSVTIPATIRQYIGGHNPPGNIFDTLLAWQCGDRQAGGKLDEIVWAFGLGRKPFKGGDFAAEFAKDEAKALEMHADELRLIAAVYQRMLGETV